MRTLSAADGSVPLLRRPGAPTGGEAFGSAHRKRSWFGLSGHPLTQLVVVVAVCAAASGLFGLLKALRGPVGMLAYGGLILSLYAYYRIGDRYFSESIWQISVACLVVMGITLRNVPFLRVVLVAALVEFGSRINRTAYPHQTVLALGVIGAMIAVATFWSGKSPGVVAPRPERAAPVYRPRPQVFDPYAAERARTRRSGWARLTGLWRRG